jgi:alkylation response protein AidB-like acyl-CoA dehydrogenase
MTQQSSFYTLMTPEIRELRARTKAFMEEHIYPNEPVFASGGPQAEELIRSLRQEVKRQGMWAPHMPKEAGGMGIGFLKYVFMNEILGRSFWAPVVFGCQAPDSGNAEILWLFGTQEQKERWLKPLVNGDIYSCFSMTEPEVAGSDPTLLRTRAIRDGDEWVINGHKWFTSGAGRAAFAIVMAVTDPDAAPHRRATMIIVPTDTPGFRIVRSIPVMGEEHSEHYEVLYENCRVPVTNTLGEPGSGFMIAQKRLGPGRIHHCMRWLGQCQRAFEMMCRRALERHAFGGPLAEKQAIQWMIAESAAEIQAFRLLTMHAAAKIDQGDEARLEVSLIKFFGAEVLNRVIDRAVQVHGALGVTEDTPLSRMFRQARMGRIYDGADEVHKMVVARRVLQAFANGGVYEFE